MNTARELVPLVAADISAFCKNLRQQLVTAGHQTPGHVAFLNMLAESAGYRNYQTLKANPASVPVAEAAAPPTETIAPAITGTHGS